MQVLWKAGVYTDVSDSDCVRDNEFINHFIIYIFYYKLILETFTKFDWLYKTQNSLIIKLHIFFFYWLISYYYHNLK